MLLAGEIDAAILPAVPTDPRLKRSSTIRRRRPKPGTEVPGAADQSHGGRERIPVEIGAGSRARNLPAPAESKKAAKLPKPGEFDTHPFGLEANRRSLEVVIDTVHQQG